LVPQLSIELLSVEYESFTSRPQSHECSYTVCLQSLCITFVFLYLSRSTLMLESNIIHHRWQRWIKKILTWVFLHHLKR